MGCKNADRLGVGHNETSEKGLRETEKAGEEWENERCGEGQDSRPEDGQDDPDSGRP